MYFMLMADESFSPEASAGYAVRMLRTARGMSQQQVADAMAEHGHRGWRQTTVAKTEAAQRPLRVNELVSLAAILDVRLEKLVAPSWYRDMAVTEVRERLTDLRAHMAKLDEDIAQARKQIAELGEEIDGLTYSRNEASWMIRLLEQRLALETSE